MNIPGPLVKSCALLALLLIAIGITMKLKADFGERRLPEGLKNPVLAMELVRRGPAAVDQILGSITERSDGRRSHDRPEMAQQISLDKWFILTYTALFVLIGISLCKMGHRLAGSLVIVLSIPAAVFDFLENLAILDLIGALNFSLPRWLLDFVLVDAAPRRWSLIKWCLIFILMYPLAMIYCDRTLPALHRRIGYLASGLTVLAATLGLFGIRFGTDALIERAGSLMGLSLLVGIIFFASYSWLSNGLLAALDRLAALPFFKQLSTWPSDEEETTAPATEQSCDQECN